MNIYIITNTIFGSRLKLEALVMLLTIILSAQSVLAYQVLNITPRDSVELGSGSVIPDTLGRSNPRGLVDGFFRSLANSNYRQASEYLDLSEVTLENNDSLIISLVQNIETILNKKGKISPVGIINNTSQGDINDGLRTEFESIGNLNLDNNSIPILLELVPINQDSKIWLISSATVKNMVAFIETNKEDFSQNNANNSFIFSKWQGAPIIEWIGIILLAVISYFTAWLITLLIKWLVRLSWRNFKKNKYSKFLRTLLIPLRLVLTVAIVLNVSRLSGFSIVVRQAFSVVNLIIMWTALFIFIWLVIDTLSSIGEERLRNKKSFGGLSAISFFRNSAKFTLIIVAILIAFDTLGFNVTAGLAALGVGGIALALGAQKTVENIVGGLSVVFDQPVSVGDFCKFGETLGTVEKIGMRSTRIRTINRTVVTIPNADFSSQLIENFALRDLFLFKTTLGLRYETTSDQMRYILVELRKIFYAHPKVDANPARVRFLGYGSDALNVELFAYIHAIDWNDFLGIQEDINFRIAQVIEDSGSGFAFPSQTIYVTKDKGISEIKKEAAESKVKVWMQNDELNLPEFDNETIEALKDSIEYPKKSKQNER